jgi:hypothetical protein
MIQIPTAVAADVQHAFDEGARTDSQNDQK